MHTSPLVNALASFTRYFFIPLASWSAIHHSCFPWFFCLLFHLYPSFLVSHSSLTPRYANTTRLLPEYTPIPVLLFSLLVCCSRSPSLFVYSYSYCCCCCSSNKSTPRHMFTRSIRFLYCLYFFAACGAFLRTATAITRYTHFIPLCLSSTL